MKTLGVLFHLTIAVQVQGHVLYGYNNVEGVNPFGVSGYLRPFNRYNLDGLGGWGGVNGYNFGNAYRYSRGGGGGNGFNGFNRYYNRAVVGGGLYGYDDYDDDDNYDDNDYDDDDYDDYDYDDDDYGYAYGVSYFGRYGGMQNNGCKCQRKCGKYTVKVGKCTLCKKCNMSVCCRKWKPKKRGG